MAGDMEMMAVTDATGKLGRLVEGQVYELAGDKARTMEDLAAEISRQAGKEIPYRNVPLEEFAAILVGAGLPEPIAQMFAETETLIAQGALFDDSRTLSRLIG